MVFCSLAYLADYSRPGRRANLCCFGGEKLIRVALESASGISARAQVATRPADHDFCNHLAAFHSFMRALQVSQLTWNAAGRCLPADSSDTPAELER